MLYRFKELTDSTLHARDREVGGIKDIYFDDRRWKVRYVVADTGGWFTGRKILISPTAFGDIDRGKETIRTNLTKDEIESSPAIGEAEPVSRKMESAISKHYGWPNYWAVTSPTLDTPVLTPSMHHARVHDTGDLTDAPTEMIEKNVSADDPALRSADEVRGYGIEATDGEVGHVDDFVCDPADWRIRYLVVDTRRILPGRKILLPSSLIDEVRWSDHVVRVRVTEAQIRSAPDFDDSESVEAQDSVCLEHFSRGGVQPAGLN